MNRQALDRFYSDNPEELRLAENGPQQLEFATAMRLLQKYLPKKAASVLDSCAGTGRYAFELAAMGFEVTAGDIVLRNVELMKIQQQKTPLLKQIYHGDALDLSRFEANSFEAVLLMGAMYHLKDAAERQRAVAEAVRVLVKGGLLIISYMNRYGAILCDSEGSLDNIDELLRFANEGIEGVFYASTPEEMSELITKGGLKIICHAALDGVSALMSHNTGLLNTEGLSRWARYHEHTCEVPSLLGSSYHNIIIAQKPV